MKDTLTEEQIKIDPRALTNGRVLKARTRASLGDIFGSENDQYYWVFGHTQSVDPLERIVKIYDASLKILLVPARAIVIDRRFSTEVPASAGQARLEIAFLSLHRPKEIQMVDPLSLFRSHGEVFSRLTEVRERIMV
jgi:hypothetical protein